MAKQKLVENKCYYILHPATHMCNLNQRGMHAYTCCHSEQLSGLLDDIKSTADRSLG